MPTPIILNGNNSALGSLAGGIGNTAQLWADAYATQVIQEQYRKRKNTEVAKTAKDYNLEVSMDAEGNLIAKPKAIQTEEKFDLNKTLWDKGIFTAGGKVYRQKSNGDFTEFADETDIEIVQSTNDVGDMTTIARNKKTGEDLWTKTDKGIGKSKTESTKVTTTVNTGDGTNKIESAANTELGKTIASRASSRQDNAESAVKQNAQYDMIINEINKGANTGWGQETLLNLKRAAKTVGFDTGDLSGQELIRSVSNQMALRLRNPESGLGLTGNTSNKDLDFLKASVTGLERTEQGNILLAKYNKKLNQMAIDMAEYQQELIDEHGGVPSNLDKKLLEYANNYQFFTPEEKVEINNTLKGVKTKKDYSQMSDDELWGLATGGKK